MEEYRREKVLEKIEEDKERADKIKMEKEALLETRHNLRKKVDS